MNIMTRSHEGRRSGVEGLEEVFMKGLRNLILVTTSVVGLASAAQAQTVQADSPANAQTRSDSQATTAPTEADTANDIVVTSYAQSLRNAIDIKRNANAVVDAISAEDIGKFPDRNVAESLSHIPGVSIDRRFGEGEKVAILGTDPALNRMLLDGHALATADWGGNDNDPSSRTFNYSLLAPELVDQLEVYKSPEARLEDGSLGGTGHGWFSSVASAAAKSRSAVIWV